MRHFSTYRGHLRNKAREMGELGIWKSDPQGAAALANFEAKLSHRRKLCAAARDVAAKAAATPMVYGKRRAELVRQALVAFWIKQGGRAASRIVRELSA